jgi:hypothetical protein
MYIHIHICRYTVDIELLSPPLRLSQIRINLYKYVYIFIFLSYMYIYIYKYTHTFIIYINIYICNANIYLLQSLLITKNNSNVNSYIYKHPQRINPPSSTGIKSFAFKF